MLFPEPRSEQMNLSSRVRINSLEDVNEVGIRVNAVQLAGL